MSDITEGTRVVSVRNVPGGSRRYLAPAIYEARRRADGTLTWRFVDNTTSTFKRRGHTFVIGFRSARKAAVRAREAADHFGIAFVPGVKHGTRC